MAEIQYFLLRRPAKLSSTLSHELAAHSLTQIKQSNVDKIKNLTYEKMLLIHVL